MKTFFSVFRYTLCGHKTHWEVDGIDEQSSYLTYLIDTYQRLIFSLCYRMTGNYFDAEDMTQETFLAAYRSIARFQGGNEKAWLCRIASNKCIDLSRSKKPALSLDEEPAAANVPDPHLEPDAQVLENEVSERLRQCCNQLREPYKTVAVACFCHAQTPAELSAATGRSIKTIQTQLYRAKAQLRKLYGRD